MGDDGPMAGIILDLCESAEVILHLDKPVRTATKPFRIQYEMRVPIVELIKYEDFYDKGGGDKGGKCLEVEYKFCDIDIFTNL